MARGPAGALVEQCAGGIERDGRRRDFAATAAAGARSGNRVGRPKGVAVTVVDGDRIAGEAGVRGDDGDDPAGEEALVELPDATVEIDGAVLANSAAVVDGERSSQRRFVDGAALCAGPRVGRRLAEQPAVGRAVIVLIDEGVESDLDVVQRGHAAEMVEAAGAQRAPEPFHLAARLGITRSRVDQREAQALAAQPEAVAAVGAAVVEIEAVGRAMAAQRGQQHVEHVGLALGVASSSATT